MAVYKDKQYLTDSDHGAFDLLHRPGRPVPHAGIYLCEACAAEVVAEKSRLLPPKDHHPHTPELGPIQWRLIVLVESAGGLGVTAGPEPEPARSPGRELALEVGDDAPGER